MSTMSVETIIRQIDELSEEDRLRLQALLDQRAELEWRQETEMARRDAVARGVDQSQIDAAIERVRYGS